MAYTNQIPEIVHKVRGLLCAMGLDKKIKIAFDEWNLRGWHHPNAHTIYQGRTKEEYLKFSEVMMDKDCSYHAFEMLYWCGLRMGELLALTPSDFDFEKKTLRINKSYQRIKGRDVITDPKTVKSNRIIPIPTFLAEEMQDYISRLYRIGKNDRIFPITKSWLHHEMDRGSKEAGVKRIRIHDLRHSHVSLLIEMGFSALAIANRVGHESIEITYRYAHLFPARGQEIADKLENEREEVFSRVS